MFGQQNYGICGNNCPIHDEDDPYDGCTNNPSTGPELAMLKNFDNIQIPEGALSTQKAAVRCCSMTGDTCISPGNPESCLTTTYDEAQTKCEGEGRRLCTLMEYLKCCGSGCNFDVELAWHSGDGK